MSLDWCPAIREACEYWRDAPIYLIDRKVYVDALIAARSVLEYLQEEAEND